MRRAPDKDALVQEFAVGVNRATTAMLASPRDTAFTDVEATNLRSVMVICGTVRNAFERNLTLEAAEKLRRQLEVMCRAYLASVRS